jgi:hypothetical protein
MNASWNSTPLWPGANTDDGERLMWRTLTTAWPVARQAASRRAMLASASRLFLGGRLGLRMPFCISMMISAVGVVM